MRSADTHIPMAGDANVVKLTGLTLSKKDGVRLSRSPRTYRATSPPSEYPTMEKRCTSPPSSSIRRTSSSISLTTRSAQMSMPS